MKRIYCNHFPLKGYKAITLWPCIFVRKDCKEQMYPHTWRHEHIHAAQQKELLILGFYLWYAVEYIVRLIQHRNHSTAYRNISFEREAVMNCTDQDYLDSRPPFAWLAYL